MGGISSGGVSLASMFLLGEQKPRNRSEWEARFTSWREPASETEANKIEIAKRKVNRALAASDFLKSQQWTIIPQGSYHNNTNVRTNSDVDLCVCLTNTYFYDGPTDDFPQMSEFGHMSAGFTYNDFKAEIAHCITKTFGQSVVQIGNKAIHIDKDEQEKVTVDVVPTFTLLSYGARSMFTNQRAEPQRGVALNTRAGARATNFPEQHYANGVRKNLATGYRYKWVVRIMKWLKKHMKNNLSAPDHVRGIAESTPSYLIECMVYNCPDNLFGNESIYDDVINVLAYLRKSFDQSTQAQVMYNTGWRSWAEVNGLKFLFRSDQSWTRETALAFAQNAFLYINP